jgi:putative transcription factor
MNLSGQDWNDVVIRKKQVTASQAQSSQAVNAALRSGELMGAGQLLSPRSRAARIIPAPLWGPGGDGSCEQSCCCSPSLDHTVRSASRLPQSCTTAGAAVDTLKKHDAGSNKTAGGKNMAKLEGETEVFAHETVSSELKKQISQARLAKKLTQAQLGQLINEKPQVINEYESGKAIPNPQVLSKMSRVLGVTLKKNAPKK